MKHPRTSFGADPEPSSGGVGRPFLFAGTPNSHRSPILNQDSRIEGAPARFPVRFGEAGRSGSSSGRLPPALRGGHSGTEAFELPSPRIVAGLGLGHPLQSARPEDLGEVNHLTSFGVFVGREVERWVDQFRRPALGGPLVVGLGQGLRLGDGGGLGLDLEAVLDAGAEVGSGPPFKVSGPELLDAPADLAMQPGLVAAESTRLGIGVVREVGFGQVPLDLVEVGDQVALLLQRLDLAAGHGGRAEGFVNDTARAVQLEARPIPLAEGGRGAQEVEGEPRLIVGPGLLGVGGVGEQRPPMDQPIAAVLGASELPRDLLRPARAVFF